MAAVPGREPVFGGSMRWLEVALLLSLNVPARAFWWLLVLGWPKPGGGRCRSEEMGRDERVDGMLDIDGAEYMEPLSVSGGPCCRYVCGGKKSTLDDGPLWGRLLGTLSEAKLFPLGARDGAVSFEGVRVSDVFTGVGAMGGPVVRCRLRGFVGAGASSSSSSSSSLAAMVGFPPEKSLGPRASLSPSNLRCLCTISLTFLEPYS